MATLNIRKVSTKVCQQHEIGNLPPAQKIHFTQKELIIVTQDLEIIQIDLDTNEMKTVCSSEAFRSNFEDKIKRYDKVIVASHYNNDSSLLTLAHANPKLACIFDLSKNGSLFWNLPEMKVGMPLCMTSDMDKLFVTFDSNKIVIFDLINRKLHDWSKENLTKLPGNFLTRYNRMLGVSQLT
jgi:hypothetical protein